MEADFYIMSGVVIAILLFIVIFLYFLLKRKVSILGSLGLSLVGLVSYIFFYSGWGVIWFLVEFANGP